MPFSLDGWNCDLACRAVIVTTGTFLRALMHTGERKTEGGRVGEASRRADSPAVSNVWVWNSAA